MGFLREIVAATRAVAAAPGYLASLPEGEPHEPGTSLRAAVEADRERGALLVEYKRVSPGRSDERFAPRTVGSFVAATAAADVTGYSCLATRPRFDGSVDDVRSLVRATERPVLFKEFVTDLRQVEAARRSGASAVLLIARLAALGPLVPPLEELARAAHERNLEVLLEFHDPSELSSGSNVEADMYGVNVRDLDSLVLDRATARVTLARARAAGLTPLLGLSGVESPEDARWFWDEGADGLLVGSAVARSEDPARFLRSLRRTRTEGG